MTTYCAWCCVWGDHRAADCPALHPYKPMTEGLARGWVRPFTPAEINEAFKASVEPPLEYRIDYSIRSRLDFKNAALSMELTQESLRISEWVLDTKEAVIRDALIKLGWTPPL